MKLEKYIVPIENKNKVCMAKYVGQTVVIGLYGTDKTVEIKRNQNVAICIMDNAVYVFGRFGNFRDEDGNYYGGCILFDKSDFEIDEDVRFYDEGDVYDDFSIVGMTEDDVRKYMNISMNAGVDKKKHYKED